MARPHATCELCVRKFKDGEELQIHKKNAHVVEEKFSCDMCEIQFTLLERLEAHMKSFHP